MSKGLLSFFSLFIALFIGAIYFNTAIQNPLISFINYLKSNYHYSVEYIQESIYEHTFQAKHINELRDKLQKYENNHIVMQLIASELNNLYKANNSKLKIDPRIELVRTISYEKLGELNRVWIDVDEYNASKVYGLIYNELVAGIIIPKESIPLGVLNRDLKSTYAVFVGKNMAPGIAHGNNTQNLIVKFIPAWFKIEVGDEVISSGLDKIFFKGLKVGKVISVDKSQGYQNAIIEPYYKANDPNYFHIIKRLK